MPIDVLHGNAVLSSFVDDARGPAGPAGAAWRWGGQLLAALVHRRVQADTRSFNILRTVFLRMMVVERVLELLVDERWPIPGVRPGVQSI